MTKKTMDILKPGPVIDIIYETHKCIHTMKLLFKSYYIIYSREITFWNKLMVFELVP